MEYLENDLYSFYNNLSTDKDKIHFAEYMFRNLISFELPEDYLDEEDEENEIVVELEGANPDELSQDVIYHISGKNMDYVESYIHDMFFLKGYLYNTKITEEKSKVTAHIQIIGKVFYDVCYN